MAKFGPSETNIGEIKTSNYVTPFIEPVKPVIDTRESETYQHLSDAIKVGMSIRDEVILGEKVEENEEINNKEALYRRQRQAILEGVGEAERDQYDNTIRQLKKLDRGEVEGVLTPAQANAKRNIILKDTMNHAPRIAPEVRQYLSLDGRVGGGARGLGGSGTSFEKAIEKEIIEAESLGMTVKELRQRNRYISDIEYQEKVGIQNKDDLSRQVEAMVNLDLLDYNTKLNAMYTADPGKISATHLKDDLEVQRNLLKQKISKYINTTSNSREIIYPDSSINNAMKRVDEIYNAKLAILESKDRNVILEDLKKNKGLRDEVSLMNTMGPMFTVMKLTQNAKFAFDHSIKMAELNDKLQGDTNKIKLTLENMAKGSGADALHAKFALREMKDKGGAYLVDVYDEVKKGVYDFGVTPQHVIASRVADASLSVPNADNDPKAAEFHDKAVDVKVNPDLPYQEMKSLLNENVAQNVRKSKTSLNKIENRLSLLQSNYVSENAGMTENDRDGWVFSQQNGELLAIHGSDVWKVSELLTPLSQKPLFERENKKVPPAIPLQLREVINKAQLDIQIRKKYGLFKEGEALSDFVKKISDRLSAPIVNERKQKEEVTEE